jgi:hypothetical protein
MIYEEFLSQRKNTFSKTIELLKPYNNIVIVELGTSRSFKSWGISSDLNDWFPNNPEKWAWSDGCFTRLFTDNLKDKEYTIHTIDPCPNAIKVVTTMCGDINNVKIHQTKSTDFLKDFGDKIDLLYMDHLESGEEACKVHLEDAKYIVENNMMSENGIILIDDCPPNQTGKGKYSIPYLLDNGFEMIIHEYQMLLKKKKASHNNIVICSLSDRPEFSEPIYEILSQYCYRHDYKLILEDKSLDTNRHIAWSKLLLIQREMKNNPDIPYVIWIDDDIIITDKDKSIQDFIDEYPFDNMLVCDDISGWAFNTGIFICKNNKETLDFLNDVYETASEKYYNGGVWENDALCEYYKKDNSKIKVIPHKTLQSIRGYWTEGDFSYHLAGLEIDRRMKVRDSILQKIK